MRTNRTGGILLAAAALGWITAQGIAHASSIQIREVVRADVNLPSDQVLLHLPKFFESEFTELEEEYKVIWSPGPGVEANTVVVQFDYMQRRIREPQSLEVKYPFAVKEQRTATFSVSKKAYRQGGEITAWRVRILQQGKVVAEQAWPSQAWD